MTHILCHTMPGYHHAERNIHLEFSKPTTDMFSVRQVPRQWPLTSGKYTSKGISTALENKWD